MKTLDLNADIGEAEDANGIAAERAILPNISSANIACGGHRGDAVSMRRTVKAAIHYGVQIGAHPAYPDRENFGRKSMQLGKDINPDTLRVSLKAQIQSLIDIAASEGALVTYVKPHGALYNDAVTSAAHANLIAEVIASLDLAFMGAPSSEMGRAAKRRGLRFIAEGFIDRRYTDDGHLQSRAIEGAVIKTLGDRLKQAASLAAQHRVKTATGQWLTVECQSLCLHGDSADAVNTARLAREALESLGITIQAFGGVHA